MWLEDSRYTLVLLPVPSIVTDPYIDHGDEPYLELL